MAHAKSATRCWARPSSGDTHWWTSDPNYWFRQALLLIGLCMSISGCTTPYEGRYSFYEGWRKAEIVRTDLFENIPSQVASHCRSTLSIHTTAGTRWAVVRYWLHGHSRYLALYSPRSEGLRTGEPVYVNVSECWRGIRRQISVD